MSVGGLRMGAGRPGWKPKAEDLIRLDARELHGMELFHEPEAGLFCCAGVEFRFRFDGQVLSVKFQLGFNEHAQDILIARTRCALGGSRPWLVCPVCKGKKVVLYWLHSTFQCRSCGSIAYLSQSKEVFGRTWRRQRRKELRLRPDGSRPVGMHWSTYGQIKAEIIACQRRRERAIVALGMKTLPGLNAK